MEINITVTQEDVDKGIGGDCSSCPVAIALLRSLNDDTYQVDVQLSEITIRSFDATYTTKTPGIIEDFIEFFDNRYSELVYEDSEAMQFIEKPKFKPFSVELKFDKLN